MLSVSLVRNTPRLQEVAAFYTLIGLKQHTSGERIVHLAADGGALLVHECTGVSTELGLHCADVTAAAEHLTAVGFDVEVWDEAYGRHAAIVTPLQAGVWVTEAMSDPYGYRVHVPEESEYRCEVCAIYYSADFDRDREFFNRLGFHTIGQAYDCWEELAGGPGCGSIGLHGGEDQAGITPSSDPLTRTSAAAWVSIQTTEQLSALAERLSAAGYLAEVVTDDAATKVHVTDPDGCRLEIHPLQR